MTTAAGLRPVTGQPRQVAAALHRWWNADEDPLSVHTSGSTGTPREVLLSRAALAASAGGTRARLGGPAAWVLALPVGFVAGLQVLVRCLDCGAEPVLLDDHDGDWAGALAAAGQAATAAGVDLRCTALVPTQLHRLDRTGALGVLGGFDAVLVGGAALDAGLRARALDAGVRIVGTYGMAETSGGCVYDGVPLAGVRVRVGADDRVHLAGPMLFDGYAGDRAGTETVLHDGWLRTDDLGRFDDRGRLEILGRADDVVVSGGVNVALPTVEQALRTHPRLRDAAATGVRDPQWGSRVVAVVVAAGPQPPDLADLRDHVARALPRSWAPRSVVVTDALPLLANGKTDRAALRTLATLRTRQEAADA